MNKLIRNMTAVAAATTLAFAGTGVASAQSSITDLLPNQAANQVERLSSDLGVKRLSPNEQRIWDAAKAWNEDNGRVAGDQALANARELHWAAVESTHTFAYEAPQSENLWLGLEPGKGTFFKVKKNASEELINFLKARNQGFNDTYGLVVSSDNDHHYLTVGVAPK